MNSTISSRVSNSDYSEIFNQIDWRKMPTSNFEGEYFSKLISYFLVKENRNNWYSLVENNKVQIFENKVVRQITNNYQKCVTYLKYYIDLRITDDQFPEISFSDCFTKIYVH